MTSENLISTSVVITCYNQAQYLGEAVESVLGQTRPADEIIVIDDGSPQGDAAAVAAGYPQVRFIRQHNQGVVAARNNGWRVARGAYVVFLDADDRLLPRAVEAGHAAFAACPECGFVSGRCRLIDAEGRPLPSPPQRDVQSDHYAELLADNYLWMPAKVMHRRDVLESLSGFDPAADHAGDWDLYLRIARSSRVRHYGEEVAEYRMHGGNYSIKTEKMFRYAMKVLRAQRPYVKGDPRLEAAYAAGLKHWREFYGEPLINDLRAHVRARDDWSRVGSYALTILRYHPGAFALHAYRKLRNTLPIMRKP